MEIKVNLHVTVDPTIVSLLSKLTGSNGQVATSKPAKVKELEEEQEEENQEDEENEPAPSKKAAKVSVETLREAASKLMIKNKAALKTILTKYDSKTVAALNESDFAGALKDVNKALGVK